MSDVSELHSAQTPEVSNQR